MDDLKEMARQLLASKSAEDATGGAKKFVRPSLPPHIREGILHGIRAHRAGLQNVIREHEEMRKKGLV